nr:hypothetical protein [Acidianus sp. HS-5]
MEGDNVKLVERYDNPALNAGTTRGVYMLKSALEKGTNAIILTKIAPSRFNFIKGKAKLFLVNGLVEEVLEKLKKGN